tara:strand:+ start:665 stop:958 length:294 start_codon:yes stop_codon:yes gene_type:complete
MLLKPKKLNLIRAFFRTRPVLKAYLFGSNVRDEANEQSDIDILVELDYSQRIGLGFVQMQMDLEKILGAKVDLVSTAGISKYVRSTVDSEKQLIYER